MPLVTPRLPPVTSVSPGLAEPPNRKIDLLFMVDDSSSMTTGQAALVSAFSSFMDDLAALPGGRPDMHIAVVTSDMGGGDGSITGCAGNGDNGRFQSAPRGNCTDTTLAPGATFISDSGGATPVTNFTAPDLATVFRCIAPVGETGCGFEHQLGSVARALGADGAPAPAENQGFLRAEAILAIVLLTNEDDCSAPVSSILYDTLFNTRLESQVGPPANFRCNEFGHLCSRNGGALAPPQRLAPAGTFPAGGGIGAGGAGGGSSGGSSGSLATVTYSNADGPDTCVSAETSGLLFPVRDFADHIKALKADPQRQIVVAAIAGPTTPYVTNWREAPLADTGPWPTMAHSCGDDSTGSFADPAVRIQQFVREFDPAGTVSSYCAGDLRPALGATATRLGQALGVP